MERLGQSFHIGIYPPAAFGIRSLPSAGRSRPYLLHAPWTKLLAIQRSTAVTQSLLASTKFRTESTRPTLLLHLVKRHSLTVNPRRPVNFPVMPVAADVLQHVPAALGEVVQGDSVAVVL